MTLRMADGRGDARADFAAGGIVRRAGAADPELMLVHRPRYDDWSLPKGHVEPGESWEQAALREVREETGFRARIVGLADPVSYLVQGGTLPKLVVFFHMELEPGEGTEPREAGPQDEVDELAWLAPQAALERMSYAHERAIVEAALAAGTLSG